MPHLAHHRYIYNQRQCGRCKSGVRSWDMAGRTVYACETCQPLKVRRGCITVYKLVQVMQYLVRSGGQIGSRDIWVPFTYKTYTVKLFSLSAVTMQQVFLVRHVSASRYVHDNVQATDSPGSWHYPMSLSFLQASANALPPARAAALAAAGPPKIFRSHCAPDEEEGTTADKVRVYNMRTTTICLQMLTLYELTTHNHNLKCMITLAAG